jgi:hypothetical protein
VTLRQPHEDAIVSAEEIAFIRRALLACSHALDWIEKNGGPQGQALLAQATRATSGDTPGHVGYDVCLAVDYLDFTTPARRTR